MYIVVKTATVPKGQGRKKKGRSSRQRPAVVKRRQPVTSALKLLAELPKEELIVSGNTEYTEYTAVLVRTNKTVRVLTSGVSHEEACKAINQNWQHRNHPENVHTYLLVTEDGQANAIVPGNTPGATQTGPAPKRSAIL